MTDSVKLFEPMRRERTSELGESLVCAFVTAEELTAHKNTQKLAVRNQLGGAQIIGIRFADRVGVGFFIMPSLSPEVCGI